MEFKPNNVEELYSLSKDDRSNVKKIDLSNLDTSNIRDMIKLFRQCYSLETLDLSSFDTSNVNNMREMFFWCVSLKELDLSSFDTSNVWNMSAMFERCNSLEHLDLSNFDTSKVENTSAMFCGCDNLKTVKLSDKAREIEECIKENYPDIEIIKVPFKEPKVTDKVDVDLEER